jgi:Zn-dependent protease
MYASQGSFSLGRLAGIPFRVHWSVVLVALLFGSGLAANYGTVGAAAAMLAFFASILLHELGHALTARRFGVSTQSIQLWALGGVARLDREAPTARAEGWIAVAGPATSLSIGVLGVGAMLALASFGVGGVALDIVGWLAVVNVVLAVFNMLPGAPLDGGRVLKAWRWGRHGDRFRAAREAANAGKAVGFSVAGVGLVMIVNGLPGLMLVVTGMFVALNAKAEMMAVDVAERLQGVLVRDLTWFGIARATDDTDADTMWWQRARLGGAGVVAVERPDGDLSGIVSEAQLDAVHEARRPNVALQSLMVPLERVAKADPDEPLSDVLSRLDPASPILTVWRSGRLVGVVPTSKLIARITAASR